jgi:MoxR-like ATPase
MTYRRMFTRDATVCEAYPVTAGDRRPQTRYVVSDEVELAVNVALATGRPLLVLGAPGSGKTSLGYAVAGRLGWDAYGVVVTSRTRAQDLLWTFDNVRRLSAALAGRDGRPPADSTYVEAGPLWWALDPVGAGRVGDRRAPASVTPGAVVVLDEIDKADPSVPNDLLRPLGDLEFEVTDLGGRRVTRRRDRPPLVVVTSNGERTLPTAFVRRCVVVELPGYDRGRLLEIAGAHFPDPSTVSLHAAVLDGLAEVAPKDADGLPAIGAAEYLDVLRACIELGVRPGGRYWEQISGTALTKQPAREA